MQKVYKRIPCLRLQTFFLQQWNFNSRLSPCQFSTRLSMALTSCMKDFYFNDCHRYSLCQSTQKGCALPLPEQRKCRLKMYLCSFNDFSVRLSHEWNTSLLFKLTLRAPFSSSGHGSTIILQERKWEYVMIIRADVFFTRRITQENYTLSLKFSLPVLSYSIFFSNLSQEKAKSMLDDSEKCRHRI